MSTLAAIVAIAALTLASAISSNLVRNPGFEVGRGTFPYNISAPFIIPGWTLNFTWYKEGPNVSSPYAGIFPGCVAHGAGAASAEFAGELVPDNLTQVIPTTPGKNYVLSFWLWNQAGDFQVQHDYTGDGTAESPGNPIFINASFCPPGPNCKAPLPFLNFFTVLINGAAPKGGIRPFSKTYTLPFPVAPYDSSFIPSWSTYVTKSFPTVPFNNADSFPWVKYIYTFRATTATTAITFSGWNWGAHINVDDVSLIQI